MARVPTTKHAGVHQQSHARHITHVLLVAEWRLSGSSASTTCMRAGSQNHTKQWDERNHCADKGALFKTLVCTPHAPANSVTHKRVWYGPHSLQSPPQYPPCSPHSNGPSRGCSRQSHGAHKPTSSINMHTSIPSPWHLHKRPCADLGAAHMYMRAMHPGSNRGTLMAPGA